MKKVYPKISIITPTYNQGGFIEETIQSILNQDYPNLEYIIIDGGSTDNTIEIIKKYEGNIAYWVSEPDNGMYHAIQKGFDKSTGDIMAWLNSDDMYHPKCLFSVAEIFQKYNQIEWLQGLPTNWDEDGRLTWASDYRKWSKYQYYFQRIGTIQQESTFWRRSLWERSGGQIDISLDLAGDFSLWLKFFRFAKLYTTRAMFAGFRQRKENQKSLDRKRYLEEVKDTFRNFHFTDDETKVMKKIERIENTFLKFPLIRSFYTKKLNQLYDFPQEVKFDRYRGYILE